MSLASCLITSNVCTSNTVCSYVIYSARKKKGKKKRKKNYQHIWVSMLLPTYVPMYSTHFNPEESSQGFQMLST